MRYLKTAAVGLSLVLLFSVLSYLYLYPGSEYLFTGRQDVFLSDGTDATVAAHQFSLIRREFDERPQNLFFGSVPTRSIDSPEGMGIWVTWLERWVVIAASSFIVPEQVPTALSFFLLILSGLAFCALSRFAFRWHWSISIGLSIAWAFSAYTRARAKVHIGFVALYPIPLLFLAFAVLWRGKSWRSVVASALLFLAVSTAPHYYILMMAFLGLFPVGYYLILERKLERPWKQSVLRLVLAVLPALIFNAYSVLKPLPQQMIVEIGSALPTTGVSETWPHPFLEMFAARPLDYFTGDTGITTDDWFPLKESLNIFNFESTPIGNSHERTNGIRWSLLMILGLGGIFAYKNRGRKPGRVGETASGDLPLITLFATFAVAAYLLSLPPSYFGGYSPSMALHAVVSQFRVSSRAGLFVHFSVLIITGLILTRWLATRPKYRDWIWLFPLIVVLELPPLVHPMPIANIQSPYTRIQDLSFEACGSGMTFPYSSNSFAMLDFYQSLQRLRKSGCGLINANSPGVKDSALLDRFALSDKIVTAIQQNDPAFIDYLVAGASCMGLRYIAFDPKIPQTWQTEACRKFAGTLDSDGLCLRPNRPVVDQNLMSCLTR